MWTWIAKGDFDVRGSRIVWIAALFALLLTGCFGGGGKPGNKPGGSPDPKTYIVSGTVKDEDEAGIKDVTLRFSDMTTTVKTDADGKWTSPALEGSVTVTPVHDDYTFDPKTRSVTKAATDVDFTGLEPKPPYAASGTIKDANDDPIEGVTVGFGDDADPVKTDEDGKWSQTGLLGAVVVTPTHDKYVFTPESRKVTEAAIDIDFRGLQKFTASGLVLAGKDAPISGAKISFFLDGETEPNGSVLTDKDGKWIIPGLFGTVTVTAEHRSYEFTPESITISEDDEVLDEFEFIGELQACDSGDSKKSDDACVMSMIEQLQMMNNNLSGHYALGAHIDASATKHWNEGKGFEPIGELTPVEDDEDNDEGGVTVTGKPFTGTFDGRGFEIHNLYIDRDESDGASGNGIGLFAYVGEEGQLENVRLEGGRINGYENVGGLVGFNEGTVSESSGSANVSGLKQVGGLTGMNLGTVKRSSNSGVVGGENWVGGLVGTNLGTVSNSHNAIGAMVEFQEKGIEDPAGFGGVAGGNAGVIEGSHNKGLIKGDGGLGVGGVTGIILGGTVKMSYNTGEVHGGEWVGGVAGHTMSGEKGGNPVIGTVANSYNTGSITGIELVGGLVGMNGEASVVQYTFNVGPVTHSGGTAKGVGALVGSNDGGQVEDSYYDEETSGVQTSAGGADKSTTEMKQEATYEGWDFEDIWMIAEGRDYPDLIHNPR